MSSGEAADFAAGAGAAFADCVSAVVGAVAALAGAAAGLAAGVIAFVGDGDDDDFVSTVLSMAGVAATDGAAFGAVGEMAGASGAALGTGAFSSVTATGAFGVPAQPEINSAKQVAVRPGTSIENTFVQDIFGPISIQQCQGDIIGGKLASEGQLKGPWFHGTTLRRSPPAIRPAGQVSHPFEPVAPA